MANGSRCVQHLQKLVLFHEICEMGLCHEDESLSIKARNDLGMKEF
jgi:hypothetical protein